MTDKLKKFIDFDVKAADGEDGTYWFTASTSTRDRQGDVIVQDTWRIADFMKNPVILWAHNYYELPIGKAEEIKLADGNLSLKIKFAPEEANPFAAKVERLVKEKYLRTGSVGFMVYKREPLTDADKLKRPEMTYGERLHGDLLEFSIVPVPANPEALNQNAYGEVIACGLGLRQDEAKHRLLPYTDEKGAFSPKLLRASVAAALGARGGIKINDAKPEACINHLYRVAKEKGVALPENKAGLDLNNEFRDVWSGELLDVLQRADEEDSLISIKLIKGEKRTQLIAARDALNTLIGLSETEPEHPKETVSESQNILRCLTAEIGELAQKLS